MGKGLIDQERPDLIIKDLGINPFFDSSIQNRFSTLSCMYIELGKSNFFIYLSL